MIKDNQAEMVEMYGQGYSMSDIAAYYDTSRQRVHQLLAGSYDRAHGGRLRKERYDTSVRAAHARILRGSTDVGREAERMGIKPNSLRAAFRERDLELPGPEPSPEHGSYYRYSRGCRCAECKEGRKAYVRRLQERGPTRHGVISSYRLYGCRCDECRAIASVVNRQDRERAKTRKRQVVPLD